MKTGKMKVCWISAGVSSFIAGYLARNTVDKYMYIDIADQHPDSIRFVKDAEKLLGKEVEIMRSSEHSCVADVAKSFGIFKRVTNGFAPCTNVLKKRVRKAWEDANKGLDITYVRGFDVDERHRADRLLDSMPDFDHEFPLIENGITKQDCHAMCARLGIKRPAMYDLGYNNNNCIGCVKGGMGYWNKIRVDFPEVFEERAKLERTIGNRILKACFLDELAPNRGRMSDEIMEDCGIFCEFALRK